MLTVLAAVSLSAAADAPKGQAEMLQALVLDLRRDPYDGPQGPLEAKYQEACKLGYAPACEYQKWHHPYESHSREAAAAMQPWCDKGDPLACLVVGWRLVNFSSDDSEAKIETADEGLVLHQKSCDAGLARACTDLGRMYYYGDGMEKEDWGKAFAYRAQACDAGDPRGCDDLADMYLMGQGAAVDKAKTAELRQKACDGGLAAACDALGDAYRNGQGVTIDFVKAAALFSRACDLSLAEGCNHLAQAYEEGQGISKSMENAEEYHYLACGMWREASCLRLDAGMRAELEKTKDPAIEKKFFDKVCDPSRPIACSRLATSYDEQAFDDAGRAKAVPLWERACALGEQNACTHLAYALAHGRGVAEDNARAFELNEAACAAGENNACENVGVALEHGCGCQKGDAIAKFQLACDHGEMDACARLGEHYEIGDGVPKDVAKATELYAAGCSRFDGDSCAYLGRLRHKTDEAEGAKLLAKACVEGSIKGCLWSGEALAVGRGVKADPFLAAEAWRTACQTEGSTGEGCVRLAALYFEGVGTRRGTNEGVSLLVDGCKRGSELACDRLWLGHKYGLYPSVGADKAEIARTQGCALRLESTCAAEPIPLNAANGLASAKAPTIPADAAKRGLTGGMCVVVTQVDAAGKVNAVKTEDCELGLVTPSENAVRSFKFAAGTPREVAVRLVYQKGQSTRIETAAVPKYEPCDSPEGFK